MQAHARARAHTHTHAHPLKRTHAHKSTGTCAATHSHNSGREAKALLFRSTHRPTRGLDCEPEHNEKCNEGCTHITFEVCRTRVYSIHGGSSRVTIMGEGVPSSQSRGTREILPACGLAAYMLCPTSREAEATLSTSFLRGQHQALELSESSALSLAWQRVFAKQKKTWAGSITRCTHRRGLSDVFVGLCSMHCSHRPPSHQNLHTSGGRQGSR